MPAAAKKPVVQEPESEPAPTPIGETPDGVTQIYPEAEVRPDAETVKRALAEAGERNKAAQSRARKANGTATTKPDPKPTAAKKPAKASKPKAAAKPRATVERVPAAEVIALIDELGITRSQLAAAVGKSASLVSEWVGKGRGHLVARSEWKAIEAAARKWAKTNLK